MIVYCTTNIINGKKYIGSDSNNNPKYLGSGVYIKKAIKKYGRENFVKVIINEVNNLEIMKELEEYWIEYFNAYESLMFYNATIHSAGVTHFPKDKIINISQANKGNQYHLGHKQTSYQKEQTRKTNLGLKRSEEFKDLARARAMGNKYALGNIFSDEVKKKISKAKTNHPCYNNEWKNKISKSRQGQPISEETKQKMRKPRPQCNRPIHQYSLSGDFIKEWNNTKEFALSVGKKQATMIIDVCKGRLHQAYNFIWKYKNK
jgi:hypothetical protein